MKKPECYSGDRGLKSFLGKTQQINKNEKEIKEFLSTMQKPLFEITKHLFAFETISKETIRDILKEDNN